MSEQENVTAESLNSQLKKWRVLAYNYLPATECDRDDVAAIDKLIQSLESQNQTLRQGIADYFEAISSAVSGVGIVRAESKLKALALKPTT